MSLFQLPRRRRGQHETGAVRPAPAPAAEPDATDWGGPGFDEVYDAATEQLEAREHVPDADRPDATVTLAAVPGSGTVDAEHAAILNAIRAEATTAGTRAGRQWQQAPSDLLDRVGTGLRKLGGPLPPSAWLRAEGSHRPVTEPLGLAPQFAGAGVLPDGRPVAGMYLGTAEGSWYTIDAVSTGWCDDAIAALTEMREALLAAGPAPVPAEAGEVA